MVSQEHYHTVDADAKTAVELGAPAMKLTLVIEGVKGSGSVEKVIRLMRRSALADIMAQPDIQELYKPLYERHLAAIDIIRSKAAQHDGVVYFDLIGNDLEGYNKFIPYYLHPNCTYSVGLSKSSFRTKVAVGSNPWARAENMVAGEFASSFELTMVQKDVGLMLETAGSRPLATLPAIARRIDTLISRGHGANDLAIIGIDSVS